MKNLDCEVLDDNTRKYDLKDITPYFEKDREIKFRAWDKSYTLTEEYINWCKDRGLFLGGEKEIIEEQEKKYEKETGLNHLNKDGRMIYNIFISNKGKMMELIGGWDYFGDSDTAIVMQYTGIKDKNGEEIYEGDIITQHKLRSESMGEVNYEVVWIDQWCAFAIATLSENKKEMIIQTMYSIYTNIEQDFEVIGNKYKNKNLIK